MSKSKMEKVGALFQNIIGFLVVAAICIITFGVAARFCNIAVAWTDELVRSIFIWLIFIGAALSFKSDSLISLDLLEEMLSKRPTLLRTLKIIQLLAAAFFSFFLVSKAYHIVATQFMSGETTPVMQVPLALVNLGYLIGAGLLAAFSIQKLIRLLFGSKGPEKKPKDI